RLASRTFVNDTNSVTSVYVSFVYAISFTYAFFFFNDTATSEIYTLSLHDALPILFGLTVGKVFLYDLGFLDRGYRIFSFFVLGAVLLAVSFLYQRRLAREKGNV